MNSAIVLAGGSSTRMGNKIDKAFLPLGPKPVVAYPLRAFQDCADIDSIVLVVRKEQLMAARGLVQMFGISKIHAIVAGGSSRQASVRAGLAALDPDTTYVAVHDAARPNIHPELIETLLKAARKTGAAIAATPMVDTVKVTGKGGIIAETLDRSRIWAAQTPQVFRVQLLRSALEKADQDKVEVTDDAQAVERIGGEVKLVPNPVPNPKITVPEDIRTVDLLMGIR